MPLFDQSCQPCSSGCAPAGDPTEDTSFATPIPPIYCVAVKQCSVIRTVKAASPWLSTESFPVSAQEPGAGDPITQLHGPLYTQQHEKFSGYTDDPDLNFEYTSNYENVEGSPSVTWATLPPAYDVTDESFLMNGPNNAYAGPGGANGVITNLFGSLTGFVPAGNGTPGTASRTVNNTEDGSVWTLEWTDAFDVATFISQMDSILGAFDFSGLTWLNLSPAGANYGFGAGPPPPPVFYQFYAVNDCDFFDNPPLDGTFTQNVTNDVLDYSAADGTAISSGVDGLGDIPVINLPLTLWILDKDELDLLEGADEINYPALASPAGTSDQPYLTLLYIQSQVKILSDMPYAIVYYVMMSDGSLVYGEDPAQDVACATSTASAGDVITIPMPTRAPLPSGLFGSDTWPVGRMALFVPNCTCTAFAAADPWETLEPAG